MQIKMFDTVYVEIYAGELFHKLHISRGNFVIPQCTVDLQTSKNVLG